MNISLGIICGAVFAIIDVLLMIPLHFEDKTAAMSAAFVNRFAIGFLIAIITKAFFPILVSGAVRSL